MNLATPSEKTVAIMTAALEHAAAALSGFLGDRVLQATDVSIKNYDLVQLPSLYGPEETPVACSAFEVNGGEQGFLLLLLPLDQADEVLQTLLGELGAPDDPALVDSVFGELGNVVASSFLNSVADSWHTRIALSPPQVLRDMVGAVLATVAGAAAAGNGQKIPVVHTKLAGTGAELSAYLLWVPGHTNFNRLGVLV